jgi:hypothetical protein
MESIILTVSCPRQDFRTEEDDKELAAIEERKKAQEARASAAASGPAADATEGSLFLLFFFLSCVRWCVCVRVCVCGLPLTLWWSTSLEKSGVPEKKGYRKIVLKKGDKTNFPKKGESVSVRCVRTWCVRVCVCVSCACVLRVRWWYLGAASVIRTGRYTGMLENGQIFDTNVGKKKSALKFKVGMGKVIRGWDEAVLEMSKGEKAKITIEPDWAYGAKGTTTHTPHTHHTQQRNC